ncbi:hypothetical protein D7V97_09465 [Corallococcus sp. CA053C]|uniref:hypothetical protein n=1 Tax=Corallococcus sp. CA053C TaxID=2316732 RepID=UPI000EA0D865|nr:hypothetical protein [Corallococcus sp. CA053C]RKH12091.1 hypothetical protein D7V97_09465 [Corallococcus sp. CA053C]
MAITVISAVYGTTRKQVDVTQICQQAVASGNDDISVNNTFMGGDPDFGVQKSFAIIYRLENAQNPSCYTVMACNEGSNLDLA